jgi:cyclic pyranopterin phosphate synthase
MSDLSHVDAEGRVAMVDTSGKAPTARRAVASARVLMSAETVAALRAGRTPKGDPLEAARIAGIMAAKRTAGLIPLCHPLPLTHADVRAELRDDGVYLEAEAATNAQTGVEMEAVEKGMTITDVRLEEKTGGKSGRWRREEQEPRGGDGD